MKRAMMVDLETLGTGANAAFAVIGWCAFDYDPLSGECGVGHAGDIVVQPQDCIDLGMTVDWDTIYWWFQQDPEARQQLGNPGKIQSLVSGLERLMGYYKDFRCEEIWSRGQDFDIAILRTAFRLIGQPIPWKFWTARDVRTYLEATPEVDPKLDRPSDLVSHIASHDAIWQAKCVIKAAQIQQTLREE